MVSIDAFYVYKKNLYQNYWYCSAKYKLIDLDISGSRSVEERCTYFNKLYGY